MMNSNGPVRSDFSAFKLTLTAVLLVFSLSGFGKMGTFGFQDILQDRNSPTHWKQEAFHSWGDIGDRAGFEIGNGKELLKNLRGFYSLEMFKQFEATKTDKLTEINSPQYMGAPRARLQITVTSRKNIDTIDDLKDTHAEPEWSDFDLGQHEGIQRVSLLPNGNNQIEILLFRSPGEVLVLTLDGKANSKTLVAFDMLKSTLPTFKSIPDAG